jgi:cell division protein FtsZ
MEKINRECENANLITGAAIDPQYAGRLAVTLITSREAGETVRITAPVAAAAAVSEPEPAPVEEGLKPADEFLDPKDTTRPPTRFLPPASSVTPEEKTRVLNRHGKAPRKLAALLQKELPLEVVKRGRFDKSEPTLRDGEDLDIPTYIRRGVALN